MAHETDFLDLYRRLGLNPGCGLEELKQAYRRHVAALHPDRQQGRPVDVRAASRLQRLTAQYGAAMDFHRRYGRLPGAPNTGSAAVPSEGRAMSDVVREMPDPFASRRGSTSSNYQSQAGSTEAAGSSRSHGRLAVVLVILALGTLGWAWHAASLSSLATSDEGDVSAQAGTGSVSHEATADPVMLHAGMSPDDVRAVEGEPLAVHGELWEYGPSWIRFDHDEVVEWHSSPLRPLHTEARSAR
ncbi:DnaJ domain-containing protein [Dyella sp. C11]|uniref:J domain-containing protein n=1 Tax=Dyella sp. C11 TaxID=2126991 RepID=UPI0018E570A3|nr:DnaJ domain-containing protein [Dyella sp. C11]